MSSSARKLGSVNGAFRFESIESVTAPDDQTVEIVLTRPTPNLLVNNLGPGQVLPLHKTGQRTVESANTRDAGMRVILPGNSAESLLVKHLLGQDDLRRMPPKPADPLTPEQIERKRKRTRAHQQAHPEYYRERQRVALQRE